MGAIGQKRDQLRTQGESESDERDKSTPEREGNNWMFILRVQLQILYRIDTFKNKTV